MRVHYTFWMERVRRLCSHLVEQIPLKRCADVCMIGRLLLQRAAVGCPTVLQGQRSGRGSLTMSSTVVQYSSGTYRSRLWRCADTAATS